MRDRSAGSGPAPSAARQAPASPTRRSPGCGSDAPRQVRAERASRRHRAVRQADRHARRRVSGADELPLPHLQRHRGRRRRPASRRTRCWCWARAPTASAARSSSTGARQRRAARCGAGLPAPIIVNCNPETVSTDYDECDRLYFEEISLETVLEICRREQPARASWSRWAARCRTTSRSSSPQAGVRVLGTSAESIDTRRGPAQVLAPARPARHRPAGVDASSSSVGRCARRSHGSVGYPVLVRPSYVLSGAAMGVASNDAELDALPAHARPILSPRHPVVISKFIENASEIEIDAVARDGELVVERDLRARRERRRALGRRDAGAAAAAHLPRDRAPHPPHLGARSPRRCGSPARSTSSSSRKNNDVKVIECNLRASRSFPFVSKVLRRQLHRHRGRA